MSTTRHLAALPPPTTPTDSTAAPGPMLESLLALTGDQGAVKAMATTADLLDWLATIMDANAKLVDPTGPGAMTAAQYRRDATLYRRIAVLLRTPLDTPSNWYDALISAFDGRFTEEALTR